MNTAFRAARAAALAIPDGYLSDRSDKANGCTYLLVTTGEVPAETLHIVRGTPAGVVTVRTYAGARQEVGRFVWDYLDMRAFYAEAGDD